MKYIDEFLEYLLVIKKHSENTIKNYQVDLLEFYKFTKGKYLKISKDEDLTQLLKCSLIG